ncbi:MAG: EamA family transporter RarD [Clostridia bacterium]|nr:EamA family transporter RarD [Clostridia bacterium]
MDRKSYLKGLIYGGSAFVLWGLLPLYWKLVKALTPYQVFSHRVMWSFVFIIVILRFKNSLKTFLKAAIRIETWKANFLPALFISINWLTYIWAVNNDFVIEASLGYYLNPLVLTLFGSLYFHEKLDRYQKIGIRLACLGVLIKTLSYGQVPYIALILAISFAIYGLLKKKSTYSSLMGLGYETLLVSIPAIIYLVFQEGQHEGLIGNLPVSFLLLISISGIVTALPLLLYAEGTKRLPLTVVGFLQYIAPTISLFLGIVVFKEPFEVNQIGPFILIWVGLIFFTASQIKLLKK